MKGKSKYLVLLLLLLVVCSGLVTYALFRTNKSGNATVNAARWNVVFKNGESEIENNFNIQLSNATWTNPLGNVASGKIAPGSQATFYITLDATNTETDVYYEAVIGDSFNDPDFEVTVGEDSGIIAYSTTSGAMIKQIPITVVWNGSMNDSDSKNSDDLLKKAQNITIPITITAAQKLALKYTVTFNDGFGNVISTKKVSEGDTVGTLPENPTKVGYTFDGWYDAVENGDEVTTSTEVTSGMNVYAHWNIKYVTVTFDSNGGSSVAQQQIQEGSTINPLPISSLSGSELIGWFDENDNQLSTSTIIMNNITYTASWYNAYSRTGTLVYYDPVSTNTCDSTHTSSSTCYKWRIIKEDDNDVTLQLDHNLINEVAWNTSGDNNNGPVTILTQLASATSSWTRVPGLTYEYDTTDSVPNNYGKLSCDNGICTITKTNVMINNVKARLISGEEIATIANDSLWSLKPDYQLVINNLPSWLVENTRGSYPNNYGDDNYGYWTLSPHYESVSFAFYVECERYMGRGYGILVSTSRGRGARPVITVPKTDLN